MDNVLHPLDDKMSMQWSTFSQRLFPLRRAKKHFRSPCGCPPLQCLLPQRHRPKPFVFLYLLACSLSFTYFSSGLQWFHPLAHTNTKPLSTLKHKLWPHLLDLAVLLFLFVPSFIFVCFLMHSPLWMHKVIHPHNHSFIHSFTRTWLVNLPPSAH